MEFCHPSYPTPPQAAKDSNDPRSKLGSLSGFPFSHLSNRRLKKRQSSELRMDEREQLRHRRRQLADLESQLSRLNGATTEETTVNVLDENSAIALATLITHICQRHRDLATPPLHSLNKA
jgi:hypothetical protein